MEGNLEMGEGSVGTSQAWASLSWWQRELSCWVVPQMPLFMLITPAQYCTAEVGGVITRLKPSHLHTHTHKMWARRRIEGVSMFKPFSHWKWKPFMSVITDTNIC